MATAKQVQLSDVPYTEDWNTYEYLVSVNAALASLQKQVDALSDRIDKEGVVTGKAGNAWYVKLPDGMLIQCAYAVLPTGVPHADVYWPLEFIDTDYVVVTDVTGNDAGHVAASWVWLKTKSYARIPVRELNGAFTTADYTIMCIATGRWK